MDLATLDNDFFSAVDRLANADFSRERLRARGNDLQMFAITQAECRHKCRTKLKDTLARNPKFIFPNQLSSEQASHELIANYHALMAGECASAFDATCGLGIDAMALARTAREVVACDIQPDVTEALRFNAANAGIANLEVMNTDSMEWLERNNRHFDVLFIDPARRSDSGRRLYSLADCRPDVVSHLPMLMSRCDKLIIKASPMLDITDTLRCIPCATHIYAIGTPTECKEVAVVATHESCEPTLHAVTILPSGEICEFSCGNGQHPLPSIIDATDIMPDKFIFEPYPALMKLNCPAEICHRYGFQQIASGTHLFIAESANTFLLPGRLHRIDRVIPFNKQGIKEIAAMNTPFNVTCRNFPLKAPELVNRLKITEGGTRRLFAVTTSSSTKLLLLT